jgi:hypothetical protein
MSETQSAREGQAPKPTPKKTLLIATAGAAVVGALIVLGAVLPAEYNQDPLGIGRATGLSRLWAPKEISVDPTEGNQPLAREYPAPFRTDVIEIPLASGGSRPGSALEYKVRMSRGATLIYAWTAEAQDGGALPVDELYYDMHGHTVVPEGSTEEMVVSTYKQDWGSRANGALIAPFDGIQGWYLQNQAVAPAKVTLRLAGFYELIAPGEEGNLAGILPVGAAR